MLTSYDSFHTKNGEIAAFSSEVEDSVVLVVWNVYFERTGSGCTGGDSRVRSIDIGKRFLDIISAVADKSTFPKVPVSDDASKLIAPEINLPSFRLCPTDSWMYLWSISNHPFFSVVQQWHRNSRQWLCQYDGSCGLCMNRDLEVSGIQPFFGSFAI